MSETHCDESEVRDTDRVLFRHDGLLLMSDFCQGKNRMKQRRRRFQQRIHDKVELEQSLVDTSFTQDKSCEYSTIMDFDSTYNEDNVEHHQGRHFNNLEAHGADIPISVDILKSIHKGTAGTENTNDMKETDLMSNRFKEGSYIDIYATIYTEDVQLLHALQVFDGDICNLYTITRSSNNNIKRSTAVMVKILPPSYLPESVTLDNHNSFERRSSNSFHIYVPPTIAASIGLHSCYPRTLEHGVFISSTSIAQKRVNINGSVNLIQRERLNIPIATKAEILEIGVPCADYIVTPEDMYSSQGKDSNKKGRDDQIELLKEYFYNFDGNGQKKEAYRLLNKGSIIAILCNKTHNNSFLDCNNVASDKHCTESVRFYKVINLESDDASCLQYPLETYWVSPQTNITLLERNKSNFYSKCLQRLPQRSVIMSYLRFVQDLIIGKSHTSTSKTSRIIPHYSANQVIQMFLTACNISMPLAGNFGSTNSSSRMFHIIGDKDNDVTSCLDDVADMIGMNVIHIDGLAAFFFRQKSYRTEGSFTITGSILDKLEGLKLSFEIARKSSPCILHINLDGELYHGEDEGSRHDAENRILSLIKEELSRSYLIKSSVETEIASVLLLVTTSKALDNGPLSSNFVHKSLTLKSPHESYTRLLWSDDDIFHHVKTFLMGRTLHEISHILSEISHLKSSRLQTPAQLTKFSYSDSIKGIIMSLETSPLASKKSISSTSTLVPKVKWEDVGGLVHVREEIIDAIELPLKFPKCFKNSKRSGVLLFGPPGTGKTLVAKAVATECGLPFLSVKGPELLGSYVGESEANIRNIFSSAREEAISNGKGTIVFFDEIDSLAPRRDGFGDGGGVMDRVVATFLSEMDKGLLSGGQGKVNERPDPCVFVIGATNRPDLLDPSLLRPGRFDRLVYLGISNDRDDRASILASLTRKFCFENNISPKEMASSVIDYLPQSLTGADFSAVCTGALMIAVKRLCDLADFDVKNILQDNNNDANIDVDTILSDWDEMKRIPRIRLDDFITSAKGIVPMMKDADMKKYEDLRNRFIQLFIQF